MRGHAVVPSPAGWLSEAVITRDQRSGPSLAWTSHPTARGLGVASVKGRSDSGYRPGVPSHGPVGLLICLSYEISLRNLNIWLLFLKTGGALARRLLLLWGRPNPTRPWWFPRFLVKLPLHGPLVLNETVTDPTPRQPPGSEKAELLRPSSKEKFHFPRKHIPCLFHKEFNHKNV